MKKLLVSVLALGIATSGVAIAQDAAAPAAPDLATVDADKSGDVSFAEAQLVWVDLTADAFAAADTDASGALSQAEFDAYVATLPAQ
ncbi:MAG: hypothetical protein EOP19_20115 [Hyphomicrobiales bacterium]|nr:MAG: hypothetical protein EOP19_20115 [Hyphomicrobiales bacterium]